MYWISVFVSANWIPISIRFWISWAVFLDQKTRIRIPQEKISRKTGIQIRLHRVKEELYQDSLQLL